MSIGEEGLKGWNDLLVDHQLRGQVDGFSYVLSDGRVLSVEVRVGGRHEIVGERCDKDRLLGQSVHNEQSSGFDVHDVVP